MTTDELKKSLTDIQTAVAAADDALNKIGAEPHLKKCPVLASARVATSAAHTRLENTLAWLKENPIPEPAPAATTVPKK